MRDYRKQLGELALRHIISLGGDRAQLGAEVIGALAAGGIVAVVNDGVIRGYAAVTPSAMEGGPVEVVAYVPPGEPTMVYRSLFEAIHESTDDGVVVRDDLMTSNTLAAVRELGAEYGIMLPHDWPDMATAPFRPDWIDDLIERLGL